MSAQSETRREKIVRFVQMSVVIGLFIGLISVALRWGALSALPAGEMAGTIAGNLIAAIPVGMVLTAFGWGIAALAAKFRGQA